MSTTRKNATADCWPPRERPHSYLPATSHRLSSGITKHGKKGGQRCSTKLEAPELGRLPPNSEENFEGPSSRTMREEIDYLVQTTAKMKDKVESSEIKINGMNDKLDRALGFLGADSASQNLVTKNSVRQLPRSTKEFVPQKLEYLERHLQMAPRESLLWNRTEKHRDKQFSLSKQA